jgi:hypothetical protein
MFFKSYIVLRHNSQELDVFNAQKWNLEDTLQVSGLIISSEFEAVINSLQKCIQHVRDFLQN